MNRYIDADALERIIRKRVYAVEVDDILADIGSAPSIDICFCEECMFADEEPIADGRYWCNVHECFMRFCSDGKERNRR